MPIFICERCGKLDNSANTNNFWQASANIEKIKEGKSIIRKYSDEYFDTHTCCALCCKGLQYRNSSTAKFVGDEYGCVSDKTYKEMDDLIPSSIYNWERIAERDRRVSSDDT